MRKREPDAFEKDLPFTSPPGRLLFGAVLFGLGVVWLVSQSDRAPRSSIWAIAMMGGGVAVFGAGVRGLLRQLACGREARRALDEHPELEAELRRAKQQGRSPGRVLHDKGYENVKVRRAILRRVDLW